MITVTFTWNTLWWHLGLERSEGESWSGLIITLHMHIRLWRTMTSPHHLSYTYMTMEDYDKSSSPFIYIYDNGGLWQALITLHIHIWQWRAMTSPRHKSLLMLSSLMCYLGGPVQFRGLFWSILGSWSHLSAQWPVMSECSRTAVRANREAWLRTIRANRSGPDFRHGFGAALNDSQLPCWLRCLARCPSQRSPCPSHPTGRFSSTLLANKAVKLRAAEGVVSAADRRAPRWLSFSPLGGVLDRTLLGRSPCL